MDSHEHRAFVYEHCDVPAGMTLTDWRRERAAAAPMRRSALREQRRRARHALRRALSRAA